MGKVEVPELKFSYWYTWENRGDYPLGRYPGIYLIAITEKSDLEGQTPEFEDVCYIGMSNSRSGLFGRWRQFNHSICGKPGHSGGRTICATLGVYPNWGNSHLYVAAMSIECNT